MKRRLLIGVAFALAVAVPAAASVCDMPADTSCCCTPSGADADGCPMIKAAPAPLLAVLPAAVSIAPMVVSEAVFSGFLMPPRSESGTRIHDAQAPPGRLVFLPSSSSRGPPALTSLPA